MPLPPWALALLAALVLAAGYAALCAAAPFGRCRRCAGTGRRPGTGRPSRHRGPHRRCAGTGRRLRIGWRIVNHSTALRRDAAPDLRKARP